MPAPESMPRTEAPEKRWLAGEPAACAEMAAALTLAALKDFAVESLVVCCNAVAQVPVAVRRVLEVGRDAPHKAHGAFSGVRELTLAADAKPALAFQELELLEVAEQAAKAIYNSTNPSDPFDLETGERLLAASAAFYRALPETTSATFSEQLLRALRSARASVPPGEDPQVPDWINRWLVGDGVAARRLASKMTSTQLSAFGPNALVACCAAAHTPSADVLRVVNVCRAAMPSSQAFQLQTAAADKRARTPPNSVESRLWSVAEQVLKVVGEGANPEELPDPSAGYYLLLAIVLFCHSVPDEARDELNEKLSSALLLARS
jgi:hypothetical protein